MGLPGAFLQNWQTFYLPICGLILPWIENPGECILVGRLTEESKKSMS
jgi:hypothetical protein